MCVGAVPASLLIGLMFVQNVRRLSECVFISIYSKSTMNAAHFLLGIVLYSTFHLAVLSEAPSLASYTGQLLTEAPSLIHGSVTDRGPQPRLIHGSVTDRGPQPHTRVSY